MPSSIFDYADAIRPMGELCGGQPEGSGVCNPLTNQFVPFTGKLSVVQEFQDRAPPRVSIQGGGCVILPHQLERSQITALQHHIAGIPQISGAQVYYNEEAKAKLNDAQKVIFMTMQKHRDAGSSYEEALQKTRDEYGSPPPMPQRCGGGPDYGDVGPPKHPPGGYLPTCPPFCNCLK